MRDSRISKALKAVTPDLVLAFLKTFVSVAGGAVIVGFGFSLFQMPYDLAAGGITGVSIIVRYFVELPAGLLYLAMNVPLIILGYRHLGRWNFLVRTLISVLVFSVTTDALSYVMPQILSEYPLTADMLLGSIYAGLITGIGSGLIYRAGGTIGGTSIISRIVQRKTGRPLSQIYLVVDGTIILTSAFTFGWEIALHAVLVLLICGMASDFALEGPSVVRTASIITDRPRELAAELMSQLRRGVSLWEITGAYTGRKRYMIYCTVNRAQIGELKQIVSDVNPDAFMVIGNAQQALGMGFRPMKPKKRPAAPAVPKDAATRPTC
jgi:uncharacterized membrane-anchored protein YitT (DUF2179 family)